MSDPLAAILFALVHYGLLYVAPVLALAAVVVWLWSRAKGRA